MKLWELGAIIDMLIITKENNKDILIPYDIEDIYERINTYYFKENGYKLDINDIDNRRKLYLWVKNKTRYKILDQLIRIMCLERLVTSEEINGIEIDNTDSFLAKNIKALKSIFDIQRKIVFENITKDDYELTKLSKKEVIMHVKNILEEIDPLLEWLAIYEEAINDNRVIYLNELSNDEIDKLKEDLDITLVELTSSYSIRNKEGKPVMILNYEGTTNDIATTMHELAHHIIKYYNDKKEEPLLSEFPSIFYELYTLVYLKKEGYSDSEIKQINNYRLSDTYSAMKKLNNLINYINMIIEKGEITEELAIFEYQKGIDIIYKNIESSVLDKWKKEAPDFFDAVKLANARCDNVIEFLILNPYKFFDLYPYIIGNYLAIMGIMKTKDDKLFLSMMKYMTEKLSLINPYDVFLLVDSPIDELGIKKTETNVKKRKK